MTRLVLDTSVLLSGAVAAATSPPAVLLDAVTASSFDVLASPRLLLEFERGLKKPYFRSRLNTAEASELLRTFRLLAITLPDPPVLRSVLRDPTDDYLVELAQAGEAEAIVTGDRDLLDHDGLRPPGNRRTGRLRAAQTALSEQEVAHVRGNARGQPAARSISSTL